MSVLPDAVLVGHLIEEPVEWTLEELCALCAVQASEVLELVEHGVVEARAADTPRFGGEAVHRVRVAVRLQRDLGVNAAGTALALELLDRIEALERQLRMR